MSTTARAAPAASAASVESATLRPVIWVGLLIGAPFLSITVYLTKSAIHPLTSADAWHGPADAIATGAYRVGVVPW